MRLQESLTEEGKGAGGGPNRFARERDPKAVEAIALLLLECDVGREGREKGEGCTQSNSRHEQRFCVKGMSGLGSRQCRGVDEACVCVVACRVGGSG